MHVERWSEKMFKTEEALPITIDRFPAVVLNPSFWIATLFASTNIRSWRR
jgi:hypothetical protein